MEISDKKISKILVDLNYASEKDLQVAEQAVKNSEKKLTQELIDRKIISKTLLGQAIAEHYNLKFVNLEQKTPSKDLVTKIPRKIAEKYHLVLFQKEEDGVSIATDKPEQKGLKTAVKQVFPDSKVNIFFAFADEIDKVFTHYHKTLNTRFVKIMKKKGHYAPEVIEEIVKDAATFNASDIHIEPHAEEAVIRFRIDGVLQEAGRIEKQYYTNILNRLKVMSQLRIDEHQSAQDGAIRFEADQLTVDMRISIVPVVSGEKTVIRLLNKHVGNLQLDELGLSQADVTTLTASVQKPFGMILVTGPTGSGKTTTLYALIKLINTPQVNITTIENPVEYKIPTINQIQVNKETNLTFAKGLRSIVRQDPDIILVGEVRDTETAEIAVNAALTGHLLFTTFHANDAAAAIPRLLEMGIEPFLLASTLELIVAQRLARRVCPNCMTSTKLKKSEASQLPEKVRKRLAKKTLYHGKGCESCNGTGYKGRVALFEIIQVDDEIQDLVLQQASKEDIWKQAAKSGFNSLFEDGLEKVEAGLTTITELQRVAVPKN